jgi:hypothetical protein
MIFLFLSLWLIAKGQLPVKRLSIVFVGFYVEVIGFEGIGFSGFPGSKIGGVEDPVSGGCFPVLHLGFSSY